MRAPVDDGRTRESTVDANRRTAREKEARKEARHDKERKERKENELRTSAQAVLQAAGQIRGELGGLRHQALALAHDEPARNRHDLAVLPALLLVERLQKGGHDKSKQYNNNNCCAF